MKSSAEIVRHLIGEKTAHEGVGFARTGRRKSLVAYPPPKPFPDAVTLDDIIKSLPPSVFVLDNLKSYSSLSISLLFLSISIYLLTILPWYLWPVGWILGGASFTGLFSIANDCMNNSFAKYNIENNIVGTLIMLPLGYSFFSMKTHRNYVRDNQSRGGVISKYIWTRASGNTFWLASVGHWAEQHFDHYLFGNGHPLLVHMNMIGLYLFGAVILSVLYSYVGLISIAKYWLLPWLAFHYAMSTVTLLPSILTEEKSRLATIHCDYPKWLEFLCNDITLCVPRNISTAIPHYHLREAYNALKRKWGDHFTEIPFELAHITTLTEAEAFVQSFEPIPIVSINPEKSEEHKKLPDLSHSKNTGFLDVLNKINWMWAPILVAPNVALYGIFFVPLVRSTMIWSFIYAYSCGFAITAGYHRLFSHRAYKARQPFKLILILLGSACWQGSILWWCRDHRAHHRYTDTEKDPYNAKNGFWYSHAGWLLLKADPKNEGKVSVEDLNQDPWIIWQYKYYLPLALFMGVIFPTTVAGVFFDDWQGGFFFTSMFRIVVTLNFTAFVNSLAHYYGNSTYGDAHTPRDSFITAILTLGEGYHNFHHEFPQDYRNAIKYYQFDPTKWIIWLLSFTGQTYDLKKFPENEIQKAQIQMRQKMLDKMKKRIDWGLDVNELPIISKEVFDEVLNEGYKLIVVDDIVHDVTEFTDEHPGGKSIIEAYIGKDATTQFKGGVYEHSNAATNLLSQMRVGKVDKKFV